MNASRMRCSPRVALIALAVMALLRPPEADGGVNVNVRGPAGSASQALPDEGGEFDVNLPLSRNAVNEITVTATDASGNQLEQKINITQLSLAEVVVAEITTERLPPERIEQLVNDGVIDLEDPDNFNVSQFNIVLTIGREPVSISVPIVMPPYEPTGYETIRLPKGGRDGGQPKVEDTEIIVFETLPTAVGGVQPPPIPGVIIIEGRIKSLKEFFGVRLLMMNTSGIFTLEDVQACLQFPDGGLSHTLPVNGMIQFGDILPGDGTVPGQKEREFIIRGDEIGVRRVQVEFAGTLSGPGLPVDDPVPFRGTAVSSVEVKGPPSFRVRVDHPDFVVKDVPYELVVEITNTGELPALYASLELAVGADAELIICTLDEALGEPACTNSPGPELRTFGHIFPGETVREIFRVNPLTTGPISSCLGVSDQNITLEVNVGIIGCLTGHFPPEFANLGGIPTVAVVPTPNTQGAHIDSPVVAFFSELMDETTIQPGATFKVYDDAGLRVPAKIRFEELNERTIAIWQVFDGISNRLLENSRYTVVLTQGIEDLDGNPLFSEWSGTFTTTSETDDFTPPELTLTILPPTRPNQVIPGEQVVVHAYAVDQGSGVGRVELRIKDITAGGLFSVVDQKTIFTGADLPATFLVGTGQLVPGHTYQFKGTAYDRLGNVGEATISAFLSPTAAPPSIVLPPDATNDVLRGVSVAIDPQSVSRAVTRVEYRLDEATTPFATAFLPPWQSVVNTLNLPIGAHTVTAVAVDGLLQTGTDSYTFALAENLNEPQVSFIGTVSGAEFVTGAVVAINAQVTDPVGLDSVQYFFDTTNDPPFFAGTQPFSINTTGLATGVHKVIVIARNVLGIENDPGDPSSFLAFNLVPAPIGPAPAAPTITGTTIPDGQGRSTISGTTVPQARVTIRNATQGLEITVTADGAGAFLARIETAGGDTIQVTAIDVTSSPLASDPATAVVPAPPVLDHLELAPSTVTFTGLNQSRALAVSAHFIGGGSADVTRQATYSSDAADVATVNVNGTVVPHRRGTTSITAAYHGFQAASEINVNIIELTNITVSPPAVVLVFTGQTAQVNVTALFSDGSTSAYSSQATYGLAHAGIVSVDGNGLVTATGEGDTQIYVSAQSLPPVPIPVSMITGLNPPPTVRLTGPADGTEVERGDPVTVIVQAEDPTGGVTRIGFEATGAATASDVRQITPPASAINRSFVFTVPTNAVIGAAIELTGTASDVAGLGGASPVVTLTVVDRTPPQVALLSPTNNALFGAGNMVTVTVQAADSVGVTEVGYLTTGALNLNDWIRLPTPVTDTQVTLVFTVPPGAPDPAVQIFGTATDVGGNSATSDLVRIELSDADITPPDTRATAVSNPGGGATATVTYQVVDGQDDLAHMELYFKRNGIGTFNRYIEKDSGDPFGRFAPPSGAVGAIPFDSTQTGGDGTYAFYTVGVDINGNREAPPGTPTSLVADVTRSFSAGTVIAAISTDTTIGNGDATYDSQNVRIDGAVVTVAGSHVFQNLELINGAVLTHEETTVVLEPGLDLEAWTITVDSTSAINVDSRGYLGGRHAENGGSNQGRTVSNQVGSTTFSSGSHGGLGGQYGSGVPNPLYGNLVAPSDLGSGGSDGTGDVPGGDGGGRIKIEAIHIAADGAITANGEDGLLGNLSGSGSGGSVLLNVYTLSGTGLIEANGGGVAIGGGGGRIGVNYVDLSTKDRTLIRALGGQGSTDNGGNGTVFLKGAKEGNGTLVVDGQGVATDFSGLPIPPGLTFDSIIIRNGARVEVDDPIVVSNELQVLNNSELRHPIGLEAGLQIRARRVMVDATSAIDASGRGYRGGRNGLARNEGRTLNGQVGSITFAGGSYGGLGGTYDSGDSILPYGTPENPIHLGSGGSDGTSDVAGGNGGGRIDIVAVEFVRVDGALRANGQAGAVGNLSGSGSGGSIRIETSLIEGAGIIEANGGGAAIGGGGGRVAINHSFIGGAGNNFNNLRFVTAWGGSGSTANGSAGTVHLRRTGQAHGDLIIDAGRTNQTAGFWTPLTTIGFGRISALSGDTLTLDGGFPVLPGALVGQQLQPNELDPTTFTVVDNSSTTLTVDVAGGTLLTDVSSVGDRYAALYHFDNVTFRRGGFLVVGDRLNVSDTLAVTENGWLTHYDTTRSFEPGLELTVGTLSVSGDSAIGVDGRGYLGGRHAENSGSNQGRTLDNAVGASIFAGASHGGLGGLGSSGGVNPIYGDPTHPVFLGSGGADGTGDTAGGDGGGRIRILAGRVQVDGEISADGVPGSVGNRSGSGSGGSILVEAGTVTGSGELRANGGAGSLGGGGGRVAVHYDALSMDQSQVCAFGGQGVHAVGGNGTLVFKSSAQLHGDLVVDGGGMVSPTDSTPWPGGFTFDNIVLRNGAELVAGTALMAVDDIRLETGSSLRHPIALESGLRLQARRVKVDATSAINVTGRGYRGGRNGIAQNEGITLHGQSGAKAFAGGSYGGLGGEYAAGDSILPYGTPQDPVYLGSGGSDGTSDVAGGNGGGRIDIVATEQVRMDGSLRANGQPGSAVSLSGSGSGGSIRIETARLEGTGVIEANGGGAAIGGGGGRVGIFYDVIGSADFDGLHHITAFGGRGSTADGSAGTVLLRHTAQTHGDLYLDAGLTNETAALWSPLSTVGFGLIAGLTNDTLTLDGGFRMLPGALAGVTLQPNENDLTTFTILDNTTTTLVVDVSGGISLTDVASARDRYAAHYRFDNLTFRRGAFLVLGDRMTIGGTLRLQENGLLTHYDATLRFEPGLEVTATDVIIASNSTIRVDARGYLGGRAGANASSNEGRTLGNLPGSVTFSGGSYGGLGGRSGSGVPNPLYGDPTRPVDLGSGGSDGTGDVAGGDGGGRIQIRSTRLIVDGVISANGANGASGNLSGSGSGGAILLEASDVTGSGIVQANGGGAAVGGGGGRVAVHYDTLSTDPSRFQALGGQGDTQAGGNGTVFLKGAGQTNGDLIIDGANADTPWDTTGLPGGFVYDNLILRNQARVVADMPIDVNGTVRILTGSVLTHPLSLETGLVIRATTLEIDATSSIDVIARGYLGGRKPGNQNNSGRTVGNALGSTPYSGGSYGGLGGANGGTPNPVYGDPLNPANLGSGGSDGTGDIAGGNGGGRVDIHLTGSLILDGAIQSDGEDGILGNLSGSGSGGAIKIDASIVEGTGLLSADGGGAAEGGGGGRIAVYYGTLKYSTNSATANGGLGTRANGQVGSVVFVQSSAQAPLIEDSRPHILSLKMSDSGDVIIQWVDPEPAGPWVIETRPAFDTNGWSLEASPIETPGWTSSIPPGTSTRFFRIRK